MTDLLCAQQYRLRHKPQFPKRIKAKNLHAARLHRFAVE